VPEGTARLRLSVTLDHTDNDLERAAAEIIAEVTVG
jgi:7-keto-8-aminopelargonate synthetase-like enzyme